MTGSLNDSKSSRISGSHRAASIPVTSYAKCTHEKSCCPTYHNQHNMNKKIWATSCLLNLLITKQTWISLSFLNFFDSLSLSVCLSVCLSLAINLTNTWCLGANQTQQEKVFSGQLLTCIFMPFRSGLRCFGQRWGSGTFNSRTAI